MNQIIKPGHYNLNKLVLVSEKGDFVNLKDIFVEMIIDESILQSTIHGSILVTDSFNLISGKYGLPIMGNEILIIELDLPHYNQAQFSDVVPEDGSENNSMYEMKQNSITYVGRVNGIKKRNAINDKSQEYQIDFCSEELVRSENIKISKFFKGTPSEIAEKVLREYIKTNVQDIDFETTVNFLKVVVPNWSPLRLINWLASRSISSTKSSPSFFFYQTLYSDLQTSPGTNSSAFRFYSLDNMLSQDIMKKFYYGLANVDTSDPNRNAKAESWNVVQDFDTLSAIKNGLFANRLLTHDIIKKEWKIYDWDYYKKFDEQAHNAQGKFYRGLPDIDGKRLTDFPESQTYMHSTGTSISPNYLEKISNRRSSQMAVLDNHQINLLVPGDGVVYSGSRINFQYKSPETFNSAKNELTDTFYDGDYLVTGIRHQFISEQYRTTLTCSKESLKMNVENYTRFKD